MTCVGINCNSLKKENLKIYFFRFPLDKDLCRLWVLSCRRLEFFKEDPCSLHYKYKLCSKHFMPDMIFLKNGHAYLMNNAVPTEFCFPKVSYGEPPLLERLGDEHGYSRPPTYLGETNFEYENVTRVVEISKGRYFICGGPLLSPGQLASDAGKQSPSQIGVLLGVVSNNRIRRIACEKVFYSYLEKDVFKSRAAKFWLKKLDGKFPPGICEDRIPIDMDEFLKHLDLDLSISVGPKQHIAILTSSCPDLTKTAITDLNKVVESSGESFVNKPAKAQPPSSKNTGKVPDEELKPPQSVLLLKKKYKSQVESAFKSKRLRCVNDENVQKQSDSLLSCESKDDDSEADSLQAMINDGNECASADISPAALGLETPLKLVNDLVKESNSLQGNSGERSNSDVEKVKCLEWIEKHLPYYQSKDFEKDDELTESMVNQLEAPFDHSNKLILQLSNAPISDTLKRDLVTILAENKDKNELEAIVGGKPTIKATKQLIKIPLNSVPNSGSLTEIKKQIEEMFKSKKPPVNNPKLSNGLQNDVNIDSNSKECSLEPEKIVNSAENSNDVSTSQFKTIANRKRPQGHIMKLSPFPKKLRLCESSNLPAHIRDRLRNVPFIGNTVPPSSSRSSEIQRVNDSSEVSQAKRPTSPCQVCANRRKPEKSPVTKSIVKPLKDYPEYILLKKQMACAKKKIIKLDKAVISLKEKVKNPPKIKVERVLEEIEKYLTLDAFTLVQSTVMHNVKDVNPHGNRFSEQLKNLGYRLMLSGVQVYKCFAHIFNLPCVTTMKKWISQYEKKHIDSVFGLNTNEGDPFGNGTNEEAIDDEEDEDEEEQMMEEGEEELEEEEKLEETLKTDHSYTHAEQMQIQKVEPETASIVPSGSEQEHFLNQQNSTAEGDEIILEEGYEVSEEQEVAALEVILEDGGDAGPLEIPIDQLAPYFNRNKLFEYQVISS